MGRGEVRSTAERRGIKWRVRTRSALAKPGPLYHIGTDCQVISDKWLAFREIEESGVRQGSQRTGNPPGRLQLGLPAYRSAQLGN
jgi:hypothetical protein